MTSQTKLDKALVLADRGFRVFPLQMNGKTPALEADWKKLATTDRDKIRRLWTCPVEDVALDYNIGIALDADTLVVDVDVRGEKVGAASLRLIELLYDPLPSTRTTQTASGGKHYYYHVPGTSGQFPAQLMDSIDLKGEGGYVVGPGSVINERAYTLGAGAETGPRTESDVPNVTDAPGWLCGLAQRSRRLPDDRLVPNTRAPLVELDAPGAVERAADWLRHKAPDHGTYKVAARVKDFGISQEKCLDLMLEHWRDAKNLDKEDDHVEFRVGNAYAYGKDPPGIASPEAEFDAVDIGIPRSDNPAAVAAKRRGLYFVDWADVRPDFDRPYLIDDVAHLGAMVVVYGDSNTGKSYTVLDQCFHIAAGRDWNGHKVQQGLVVYVAAEGGTGFHGRIAAFRKHYGVDRLPFALVPCPIDLHAPQGDTDRLIRLVREAEAHFGQKCVYLVIDTLARAMAGGDENTAMDMGVFVRHCDRIRVATSATIGVIHHTGKDTSKGARGSSALRAATDTEIEVKAGEFSINKQRDMRPVPALHFELDEIEIGARKDGKRVTACVVRWITVTEFEAKLTPDGEKMMERFASLMETAEESESRGDGAPSVAWSDWKMSALSYFQGVKGKKVSESYLFNLRKELLTNGLVLKNKQGQWVSGNTHWTHP